MQKSVLGKENHHHWHISDSQSLAPATPHPDLYRRPAFTYSTTSCRSTQKAFRYSTFYPRFSGLTQPGSSHHSLFLLHHNTIHDNPGRSSCTCCFILPSRLTSYSLPPIRGEIHHSDDWPPPSSTYTIHLASHFSKERVHW